MTRFFVWAGIALLFVVLQTPPLAQAEVTSADVAAHRAELQRQLDAIEADIAAQRGVLSDKQKERQSLERDIGLLDGQIKTAQLAIKARDLNIQTIAGDITDKVQTIDALHDKLTKERQSLAEILRKTNVIDQHTMTEFILGAEDVSTFFGDLDSFAAIKNALHKSFSDIADTVDQTAQAKLSLEDKKVQEESLRQAQIYQQQQIKNQQAERTSILKVTKGQEAAYQTIIKQKEKTAAEIRSELFALRDSAAIPFGKALDYANFASQKTGVRPALILGILSQETDLGENLGTGSYTVDMHPTRDVPVFLVIAATLGYIPNAMPVSKQPGYGWGGAMGPGQFIPSTWACYGGFVNTTTGKCGKGTDGTYQGPWVYNPAKDLVSKTMGKGTPSDPWQNQDAFVATALLMKENGAAAGTAAAERLAALRYFAGYGNASNPAYAFYGDGVMKHAAFFQQQIDILTGG